MSSFRRRRIGSAHAIAFLALVLAIAGGAAALPGKNQVDKNDIRKNAVNSADIKNNSVASKDLKNGSAGGADVKDGSLSGADLQDGSATGADVKDDSLTGADIDESTLGQVPSAASAASSEKTSQIANIFYPVNKQGPTQTVLEDFGGLTLTATCSGETGEIELKATTSVSHSFIDFVSAQNGDYADDIDFNVGEVFDADANHVQSGAPEIYTLQYTTPEGVNVVLSLHDIDSIDGGAFNGTPQRHDCVVAGAATLASP